MEVGSTESHTALYKTRSNFKQLLSLLLSLTNDPERACSGSDPSFVVFFFN